MPAGIRFPTVGLPGSAEELRAEVREFLSCEITAGAFSPRCDSWLGEYSPEFSRKLGERGWLGMNPHSPAAGARVAGPFDMAQPGEEHDMADLEYRVENGVGTILLNRPEKKDAFTLEMLHRWAEIYREACTDDDVGAIVLTGAGDAFCSGGDLGGLAPSDPTPYDRNAFLTDHVHRVIYALEELDKPVIAAVNGAAVGAGMDMSLMCDMRFAARSARFSEGYVRVGLVPGDGGAYFLPRLVGTAKALELLLTGDFVDAVEAHRVGIVNRVYEDEELAEETRRFAERLAAGPPLVTRMIKRTVYQSVRSDLRTSLDLVSSHMAIVQSTEDSKEALSAFLEKREPKFRGR